MDNKHNNAIAPLVVETYNATLAGLPASAALAESLRCDWLPALSALLRRDGRQGARWLAARALLARLGWLLRHLPQASPARAELMDGVIRGFRGELDKCAPLLFMDAVHAAPVLRIVDEELIAALQTAIAPPGTPVPSRPLLPALRGTSVASSRPHPHDREASGVWQAVLGESRRRRRVEHDAVSALEAVAALRSGDRIALLLPGGGRQTWRVLRRETSRDNVLMENEETLRQGVLGLQTLAAQLAAGRLAILA